MDYRRLNITQLSKETNTNINLLYDWQKKGYLTPTQISGNRKKFSINAFLEAEKKALNEQTKVRVGKISIKPNGLIPDEYFDNIELFLD